MISRRKQTIKTWNFPNNLKRWSVSQICLWTLLCNSLMNSLITRKNKKSCKIVWIRNQFLIIAWDKARIKLNTKSILNNFKITVLINKPSTCRSRTIRTSKIELFKTRILNCKRTWTCIRTNNSKTKTWCWAVIQSFWLSSSRCNGRSWTNTTSESTKPFLTNSSKWSTTKAPENYRISRIRSPLCFLRIHKIQNR